MRGHRIAPKRHYAGRRNPGQCGPYLRVQDDRSPRSCGEVCYTIEHYVELDGLGRDQGGDLLNVARG